METYYLAHPLKDRKQIRQWQLYIEKECDIKFINPFYFFEREEIKKLDKMTNGMQINAYKKSFSAEKNERIVEEDLEMIRNSDGILAFINDNAIGTVLEVQYAYSLNKPIFIVTKYINHAWLCYYATKIFARRSSLNAFLRTYKKLEITEADISVANELKRLKKNKSQVAYKASFKGKQTEKRYVQSEKGKKTYSNYCKTIPKKRRAKNNLGVLFFEGDIDNSEFICAICGKQPVEKHHENYNLWYSFIPLCKKCHSKVTQLNLGGRKK